MVINYYLSLLSPYAYLGHQRLNKIAATHKIPINYIPINMELVFSSTGGLPLSKRGPFRQRYRLVELQRWGNFLNIPINLKPQYFPTDEWPATKLVIREKLNGFNESNLIFNLLKAVWIEDRDIGDTKTLQDISEQSRQPQNRIINNSQDKVLRQQWESNSKEAISSNVFGVPSYIFNGQLFWGQDRLDFLERAIVNAKFKST